MGLVVYNSTVENNPPLKPIASGNGSMLGFKIEAERLLIVYGGISGLVTEKHWLSLPANCGYQSFLDLLLTQTDRVLALIQAQHLPMPELVSVSIAANYQASSGLVLAGPQFPEWKDAPLRRSLGMRFNLPVYVEDCSRAGALAESFFGVAQGGESMIFLSQSPVLRAALMNKGRLLTCGRTPSGDIGRLRVPCEDFGEGMVTLNSYASVAGLEALAKSKLPEEAPQELEQIFQAAEAGLGGAHELLAQVAHQLARGLLPYVYLFQPELIVLAAPFCRAGSSFYAPLNHHLQEISSLGLGELPQVLPSKLGAHQEELEALAAGMAVMRGLSKPDGLV